MTLKQKGPVDNTPARLGPSTGEQCDEICDECLEHLGRIADEAQNFAIPSFAGVSDYRFSSEWRTCYTRAEELVREAADTVRSCGERVREILRDKIAIEKRLENDWPAFEGQLRRLFPAIREIYNSAGNSLLAPPIQRLRGRIMDGSDSLELNILARMKGHYSEIRRARKAPLEEFYAWRAKERSQSARENTESESKRRGNQSGRGPMAKEGRHRAIARWVAEFQRRYGDNWRKKENLERIAERLHNDPLTPPSKTWADWRPPARSWRRAVQNHPDRVVKTLEYSLKWARQHSAKL